MYWEHIREGLLPNLSKEYTESFDKMDELIGHSLKETRAISHNLAPFSLKQFGLRKSIQQNIQHFRSILYREKKIRFEDNLGDDRFKEATEITIYRLVQEVLHNFAKYAGNEAQLLISLYRREKYLVLMAVDNGRGFDPDENGNYNGLGINTLKERVESLRGEFRVHSSPGQGCRYDVRIPAEKERL